MLFEVDFSGDKVAESMHKTDDILFASPLCAAVVAVGTHFQRKRRIACKIIIEITALKDGSIAVVDFRQEKFLMPGPVFIFGGPESDSIGLFKKFINGINTPPGAVSEDKHFSINVFKYDLIGFE